MLRLINRTKKIYLISDLHNFEIKFTAINKTIEFNNKTNIKPTNFNTSNYSTILWKDYINKITNDKILFNKFFDFNPTIYNLQQLKDLDYDFFFIKPNKGSNGENIHLLNKKEIYHFFKHNNIQDYFIQQKITPHLFNLKKYDLRMYYFNAIINKKIYGFYAFDGKVRISQFNYNEFDKTGIITNSSQQNNNSDDLQDNFLNFFNKDDINTVYSQIKNIHQKFIYLINNSYKDLYNQNIVNLYGIDFMKDNAGKFWVIEINGNPNWYHKNDSKKLHKIKTNIFEDITNILTFVFKNKDNIKYWKQILT